VIEELAFRGIMFGALLRAQFSPRETVLLTAFAFALLHLSIPSLVTHVPLGLYFGWLRQRSGSLWPGMLAHACHNAGVLAINALGWG
jgi:membrane protease YdiL (CAAX protease family)